MQQHGDIEGVESEINKKVERMSQGSEIQKEGFSCVLLFYFFNKIFTYRKRDEKKRNSKPRIDSKMEEVREEPEERKGDRRVRGQIREQISQKRRGKWEIGEREALPKY